MNNSRTSERVILIHGLVSHFSPISLIEFLSEEEVLKANRFLIEKDRNAFIVCRALLRTYLSVFLKIKPPLIEFKYSINGKPFLRSSINTHFNVSHSEGVFVIGISLDGPIGVDVESTFRKMNVDILKNVLLNARELQYLQQVNQKSLNEVFIHFWTAKEAVLKALGCGLSIPPNQIDVPFPVSKEGNDSENSNIQYKELNKNWKIRHFNLEGGFKIAVAIEGQNGPMDIISHNEFVNRYLINTSRINASLVCN